MDNKRVRLSLFLSTMHLVSSQLLHVLRWTLPERTELRLFFSPRLLPLPTTRTRLVPSDERLVHQSPDFSVFKLT